MTRSRKSPTKVAHTDYITSDEAMALLGVQRQTFYTYVSRGLIRRHETPGQRRKLYLKSDLERLAAKSSARRPAGVKAGDAMHYGSAVMQTLICAITPDGPVYRNRLATDLCAANAPFEAVAELLWVGRFRTPTSPWQAEPLPAGFADWADRARHLGPPEAVNPVRVLAFLLMALSSIGTVEDDSSAGNTLQIGRQLLQMFAGVAGYLGPQHRFEPFAAGDSIAGCMARGFGRSDDLELVNALNAALVICAEHELAPPTFATRVCASTGADIYACVATGVLAHMGPLQGGGADGAEELLTEVLKPDGHVTLPIARWSSRFDFPGFNHQLYPRDPRGVALLERIKELKSPRPEAARILALFESISEEMQFHPSIIGALVALTRSLALPPRSANLIFSVGRASGWIAHVLEQRMAGFMLRPRAQFVDSVAQPFRQV